MPSNYQSKSIDAAKLRLAADEQEQRDKLATLVRNYESVRTQRGPEYDHARVWLEYGLRVYGRTFQLDGWLWKWSKAEQSIMRSRAMTGNPSQRT